ncbi:pantothenate transporter liz1 [Ophiostoma piceae UAMH 11346]|uniref:Pantothenate transporter liz1 n=1 Tax=Ophiostoma piceae (strain UAMH 11346) TaxID=1262450 RepID=S3CUN8_OPHP1|nr:pantothenate transporter liz1 [Ophiostoma piceae UAMH 11346]
MLMCRACKNIHGDEYNLFNTLWAVGYAVGMIPSQGILTHIRPYLWLPVVEDIWTILKLCRRQKHQQIYAMYLLFGIAESPFYVGGMTLLGSWYSTELATIFTLPRFPSRNC